MRSGVPAAAAAMEQAIRRLEAALGRRAETFRQLSEQHGQLAAELKVAREELQAARDEAASLRDRAALVDALREELAQIQAEREEGDMRPVSAGGGEADAALVRRLEQAVAARDEELAALKDERDALRAGLAAAQEAEQRLRQLAELGPGSGNGQGTGDEGEVVALRAELAAARAAQAEMQAFQSGIAARLEVTMARLRQALDAEIAR